MLVKLKQAHLIFGSSLADTKGPRVSGFRAIRAVDDLNCFRAATFQGHLSNERELVEGAHSDLEP